MSPHTHNPRALSPDKGGIVTDVTLLRGGFAEERAALVRRTTAAQMGGGEAPTYFLYTASLRAPQVTARQLLTPSLCPQPASQPGFSTHQACAFAPPSLTARQPGVVRPAHAAPRDHRGALLGAVPVAAAQNGDARTRTAGGAEPGVCLVCGFGVLWGETVCNGFCRVQEGLSRLVLHALLEVLNQVWVL